MLIILSLVFLGQLDPPYKAGTNKGRADVSFNDVLNNEHADNTSMVVQTSGGEFAVTVNIISTSSNPVDLTSYV